MGQARRGRIAFRMIVGLVSAVTVASCGSTSPKGDDDGEPEGGETQSEGGTGAGAGASGGSPTTGGSASGGVAGGLTTGGRSQTGGSGGTGGRSGSTGGTVAIAGTSSGGRSNCLEGVPCTCDEGVGVTECEDGESTCSCPPPEECEQEEPTPCFEPCGGAPFGAWLVEETCLSGIADGNRVGCQARLQGESKGTDLRIRILDGGELQVVGSEMWEVNATASLECFGAQTVTSCDKATLWTDVLLMSSSTQAMTCEANACGVCDCSGTLSTSPFASEWRREGTSITLGDIQTDYCVDGDEMWIGGTGFGDGPKVSYKLKKQSCEGTPVPCSERTKEECTTDDTCTLGQCVATSGSQAHCANGFSSTSCNVIQNCRWEPDVCTGDTHTSCLFELCDRQLGCSWGEPRERCGGFAAPCMDRGVERCAGSGCALRSCIPAISEFGDCSVLSAADCAKAPGCTVSGATCTGTARCTAQTDDTVCNNLGCVAADECYGTPTECSTLSAAQCHDVAGCRIEW